MKSVRPLTVVVPLVMLLASCTAGPPTGLVTRQAILAVKQALPRSTSPASLRCPRTLPTVAPGSEGSGSVLVPGGPTKAVQCVYAGGNNRGFGYGALIGRVVVPVPSALAWAIDESIPHDTE